MVAQPPSPSQTLHTDGQLVWYCGIGSMMNGTALRIRGVHPVRSLWGEIKDHRRVFYASSGMATLVHEEGALVQVVAHQITEAELQILEGREPPSVAVRLRLRGQEGRDEVVSGVASVAKSFFFLEGVQAKADQIDLRVMQVSSGAMARITAVHENGIDVQNFGMAEFDTTSPVMVGDRSLGLPRSITRTPPLPCAPSARYLDLMCEGAREVRMDECEVSSFAAVPCTPRKSPEQFSRLVTDSSVAACYFSKEDAEKHQFAIFRGMVFKREGPQIAAGPMQLGQDMAFWLSHQLYDPVHGIPPKDPLEPWAGWPFIEDMACGFLSDCKHIGWIKADGHSSKL